MRTRFFGLTGLRLSVIGLGAWAMGGGGYKFGWGPQDDEDSIATIHRALELGINWIDTAPIYGDGHSEEIIGKALKDKRGKMFISTKCGIHLDENKNGIVIKLKEDDIRKDVEASLRRLQTDYIDFYQVHIPGTDEENLYAWGVLKELQKEGKIRWPGLSNFDIDQLKKIHKESQISFIQPIYNMLEPMLEEKIRAFCSRFHIGILAHSPLCRGLLTGKFTRERAEHLAADDNRAQLYYFKEPYLTANLELVECLQSIAEKYKRTVAHLAIAWALRSHIVTSVIVGARKPGQIEETAPAGDWGLPITVKNKLIRLLSEHHARLKELKNI